MPLPDGATQVAGAWAWALRSACGWRNGGSGAQTKGRPMPRSGSTLFCELSSTFAIGSDFAVYKFDLKSDYGTQWSVLKRYSEIRAFHKEVTLHELFPDPVGSEARHQCDHSCNS